MMTIKISCRTHGLLRHEVPVTFVRDGLAVTPELVTGCIFSSDSFRVTHVRSGMAVPGAYRDRRRANAALRALLKLTNWDRPYNRFTASKSLTEKVFALVADTAKEEPDDE